MDKPVDELIERLASMPSRDNVTNPYFHHSDISIDRANAARRRNLKRYLNIMLKRSPSIMWVGEAPGYRGCRISGVPFTSESILLNGESSIIEGPIVRRTNLPDLFGSSQCFEPIPGKSNPQKENTATLLWKVAGQMDNYPLLWNAFPLHPHLQNQEQSNRRPSDAELLSGAEIISQLLSIFDIKITVAVGRAAERSLKAMNIEHQYVRHPSHGGKAQFIGGIVEISDDTNLNRIFKHYLGESSTS